MLSYQNNTAATECLFSTYYVFNTISWLFKSLPSDFARTRSGYMLIPPKFNMLSYDLPGLNVKIHETSHLAVIFWRRTLDQYVLTLKRLLSQLRSFSGYKKTLLHTWRNLPIGREWKWIDPWWYLNFCLPFLCVVVILSSCMQCLW